MPVTVVVSATPEQLQTAAGAAVTAGGTLLPMPDLIRMASHAYHYLCIFDKHTERALYLGRTKRIASADQRIVARERPWLHRAGMRRSGLPVRPITSTSGPTAAAPTSIGSRLPADHTTDPGPGGWQTRKRRDGSTEWLPPPGIPFTRRHERLPPSRAATAGGDDIA